MGVPYNQELVDARSTGAEIKCLCCRIFQEQEYSGRHSRQLLDKDLQEIDHPSAHKVMTCFAKCYLTTLLIQNACNIGNWSDPS